ncbi:DUF535 family protein [uncultured Veillonella sp.]|uniref:VirK/YbjX family protein n=1 Tax=uncultured Veillonella sp. TaxID=159268 RepID=UPI0026199959|nr:DUF535 family protein [uncultured Veillonella sp.]
MFSYGKKQWGLGKEIYGNNNWRQKRRITLFLGRSYKNRKQVIGLKTFFDQYEILPNLLKRHEGIHEVINRVFLYKNSTAAERLQALKDHFNLLPKYFKTEAIQQMYDRNPEKAITILADEELDLRGELWFDTGQRKEGFLSLFFKINNKGLYHINFRLGYGFDGAPCIWIGTIQGYKDGLEAAKKITKKMHGYRPKNFTFFLMRQLAEQMGIHTLYAVSDEGFYTNSHLIRFNRSKKVKFDPFWQELGGVECSEDKRFFRIPLEEERKTYEEMKTHKRNMYRKRYEMLDAYIEAIKELGPTYLV